MHRYLNLATIAAIHSQFGLGGMHAFIDPYMVGAESALGQDGLGIRTYRDNDEVMYFDCPMWWTTHVNVTCGLSMLPPQGGPEYTIL
jgi:hypothetical protein